jgi:hypothetical protein
LRSSTRAARDPVDRATGRRAPVPGQLGLG